MLGHSEMLLELVGAKVGCQKVCPSSSEKRDWLFKTSVLKCSEKIYLIWILEMRYCDIMWCVDDFLTDLPCRRIVWFSTKLLADIGCNSCTLNDQTSNTCTFQLRWRPFGDPQKTLLGKGANQNAIFKKLVILKIWVSIPSFWKKLPTRIRSHRLFLMGFQAPGDAQTSVEIPNSYLPSL